MLENKPGRKYNFFYFSIHHMNFFWINLSGLKLPSGLVFFAFNKFLNWSESI